MKEKAHLRPRFRSRRRLPKVRAMRTSFLPFVLHPPAFPTVRSYRRLCLIATALLGIQLCTGLLGEIPPRREVFPFASWFLFAKVPSRVVEYDLEFRTVDSHPLEPPLRFSRASGWVNQPHGIASFQTIQALGQALDRGDQGKTRALRRQIEAFCGPVGLGYDVVKVTYDPVPRYLTGATLEHRVLGSFTAREF